MDTKEIADKKTLPLEVYDYVLSSDFLPKWQWSAVDPVTRIRFLAWSYSKDWSCGQVFAKMVIWWLRLFGFQGKVIVWSEAGKEFNALNLAPLKGLLKHFDSPSELKESLSGKAPRR